MKHLLLGILLASSFSAFADEKAEKEKMEKVWKEYSTPGEAHKRLAALAGKWTYVSKWWMTEGAKPDESKGTADAKVIMGGRYLQMDMKGKSMGMDWEATNISGYDNLKKEYSSVFFDNMGTGITQGHGKWNEENKSIDEEGSFTCPMKEGNVAKYKATWNFVDKNTMVYTMWTPDMKTKKEFKSMEMTYKR
jgi:Protein of unknown function (DUF1579)